MRRRPALVALVLALPLVAWTTSAPRLADWGGVRIGEALATAVSALPRAVPRDRAPTEITLPGERDADVVVTDDPPAPAPGKKAHARPVVRGIHVGAATVLRLAGSGVRPSGAPVPASGVRPAGLALSGLGGLGVGLRDGDVLTEVAGAAATSEGAVVGAVIAARDRRAPAISGQVWRGVEIWQIVVDMPYPR